MLEWLGTLALLALLLVLVPVIFMAIITLQFRLTEQRPPRVGQGPPIPGVRSGPTDTAAGTESSRAHQGRA